jgi:hypothetical protein
VVIIHEKLLSLISAILDEIEWEVEAQDYRKCPVYLNGGKWAFFLRGQPERMIKRYFLEAKQGRARIECFHL